MLLKTLKFIDLFAGIGGLRLGLERACQKFEIKPECVFTSEIDKYACEVYRKNFPNDNHNPQNDVRELKGSNLKKLDRFDILLAGFPCQAFSIAGKKKGFADTRGTLFFDIERILAAKKPHAFILENVKGLKRHKSGETLATILHVLRSKLGYVNTDSVILNSKDFGVPQNRERIYIVGSLDGKKIEFPSPINSDKRIKDILEKKSVSVKYYLSERYFKSLKKHRQHHESLGNGFGYEIKAQDDVANAIVIGGMGKERNLVIDKKLKDFTPITGIKGRVNREGIRRMTPMEWERLQGFPDNFTNHVSDAQRYKQLGNAVTVPTVEQVAIKLLSIIFSESIEKIHGETTAYAHRK